ncbi:MAG: NAD(P)H-quinone oxidoreductase, partial [Candidatus Dormibacteria bacterium]
GEVDLSLLMSRRARIFGSTLRARSLAEKALVLASVEKHLLPLLQSGKLRVPLAAGFALSHAGDAYSHLVKQGKLGKIVLLREEP